MGGQAHENLLINIVTELHTLCVDLWQESNDPAVSAPFDLYEFMLVVEQESPLSCNFGFRSSQ